MKKLTIIFYLFLIPLCVFAQNESSISHTKTVNDSTLIKIHAIVVFTTNYSSIFYKQ